MYCKHGKPYVKPIKEEEEEHLFLLELVIESIIAEQSMDRCMIHESEPFWTAAFWLMDTFSFEIKQDEEAQAEDTVFSDSKLRRVKFNAGKSCLFLAKPYKLLSIIQQHPVYVSVQTQPENAIVPDILGRGKIPFDPAMIYDIQESIDNKTPNVECSRAGCYPLYDCGENEVGHIKCFLRLSYYGRNIQSEFKLMGGMDDLVFKVDKSSERNRCCKCGNRLKSAEKGGTPTHENKDPTDFTRQNFPRDSDDRDIKRNLSWKKVYSCSSKTTPCNKKCSSHHFHEFLLLAKGSEPSEASKPSSTYEGLKRIGAQLDLEEFITELDEDPLYVYQKARANLKEEYAREMPVIGEEKQCTCERLVDIYPPRGAQLLEDKDKLPAGGADEGKEKIFVDECTDCLGLGEEEAVPPNDLLDQNVMEEPIPVALDQEERSPQDADNLRKETEEARGPPTVSDVDQNRGVKGKGSGQISGRGPKKTRDPDLGMRRPPKPQAGPSRIKKPTDTDESKPGHGCSGHKECLHPHKKVPKGMGWLWTESQDLGRDWKPGTVSPSVVKMMEVHRINYGRDRGDFLPRGKELPKTGKNIGQIPDMPGSALRFRMHKGSYLISMNEAGNGEKSKDKKDQKGLFLRINKKVDEDAYSSSSDLEFEFIAPTEKKENADITKKTKPFSLETKRNPQEIMPPLPINISNVSSKVARPQSPKSPIPRQNRSRGNVESKETQVGEKDLEKIPEQEASLKKKNPKKK